MIINVIGQKVNKIRNIKAYNGVVSYYWEDVVIPILQEYHDVKFYDAREIDSARDCERTFLICPYAITTGLDLKPVKRFGIIHRLFDAWVCLAPINTNLAPDKRYNITYGVDPEFLYPEQSPYPTIFIQEFFKNSENNKTIKTVIESIESIKNKFKDVHVFAACLKHDIIDKTIFMGQDYLPWIDICNYYRKSWITIDLTPFLMELSKLECAAAGNVIISPKEMEYNRPHSLGELNIINQKRFSSVDDLISTLENIIANWTPSVAQNIHKDITTYFTWKRVAYKVLNFLENEDGPGTIKMAA